jgi:hypothetical protein
MADKTKDELNAGQRAGTAFAAGQAGAAAAAPEAAGTEAMRLGMQALLEGAKKVGHRSIKQAKGNLFEYIESAKLNAALAESGSTYRSVVTEAVGDSHAAADIKIHHQVTKNVTKEVQAKAGSASYVANVRNGLADEKYSGMGRLTSADRIERVREVTERRAKSKSIYADQYKDSAKNLSGEHTYDGHTSGGTTLDEAREAVESPRRFALKMEAKAVGKQAAKAGLAGMATGGLLGGAMSTVKNCYAVKRGQKSSRAAAFSIAVDTSKSAAKGGSVAATGSGVSFVATKIATRASHSGVKVGLKTLSKSNVATGIAAGTIEILIASYGLAKGDITAEQFTQRIGQTGASTLSSLYAGAAAGSLFGPPGAIIGSVAGYMVATQTYQSCIAILQEADLAEEQAERVVQLAHEAIEQLEAQRSEFEEHADKVLGDRREEIERWLNVVDASSLGDDHALGVEALAELAGAFGHTLQLEQFEEFDAFMLASDSGPLVL